MMELCIHTSNIPNCILQLGILIYFFSCTHFYVKVSQIAYSSFVLTGSDTFLNFFF